MGRLASGHVVQLAVGVFAQEKMDGASGSAFFADFHLQLDQCVQDLVARDFREHFPDIILNPVPGFDLSHVFVQSRTQWRREDIEIISLGPRTDTTSFQKTVRARPHSDVAGFRGCNAQVNTSRPFITGGVACSSDFHFTNSWQSGHGRGFRRGRVLVSRNAKKRQ